MNDADTINFSGMKLGDGGGPISIELRSQAAEATAIMTAAAHSEICIYSRHLDPQIYDSNEFLAALKEFAIRSPHARARILIQDTHTLVANGHRVLDLARRLSSFIQLRKPHPDYTEYNRAFLTADDRGLIQMEHADRYTGVVEFNNPLDTRKIRNYFDEVWEKSITDPELKRLHV